MVKQRELTLKEFQKELLTSLPKTAEEKAYEEYAAVFGAKAEVIAPMVSMGYPKGVKEHGGVIAIYKECISKGVTWQELLHYQEPPNNATI